MALRAVAFDLGHTVMDERLDVHDTREQHCDDQLMPGVRDAFAGLTLPLAIWANTRLAGQAEVRRWLERAELSHQITWVITSIDAGARKPAREFFNYALRTMEMGPSEVLFVGNQRNTDIAGGIVAGIRTVLLTHPCHHSIDDADVAVEPTFTIGTLHELPGLVATLLAAPRSGSALSNLD